MARQCEGKYCDDQISSSFIALPYECSPPEAVTTHKSKGQNNRCGSPYKEPRKKEEEEGYHITTSSHDPFMIMVLVSQARPSFVGVSALRDYHGPCMQS